MVFKELIYTLSKAVSSINVTEFSEGGRDSTKKTISKALRNPLKSMARASCISLRTVSCIVVVVWPVTRAETKKVHVKIEGKQRNNTDMYYDSNDSCPLFFVSLKVDNILYIILRLKRTNTP